MASATAVVAVELWQKMPKAPRRTNNRRPQDDGAGANAKEFLLWIVRSLDRTKVPHGATIDRSHQGAVAS
jgi:hypothetical protein